MQEELPWAILANGPACTMAGVFCRVCRRLGISASLIKTAIDPATPRSSAVMGRPLVSVPMTMRPRRSRRSLMLVARAKIAMISLATVMSNPVWRGAPFFGPPSPAMICRRATSDTSTTRFQRMEKGSMLSRLRLIAASDLSPSSRSCIMRASMAAARRLWATPTAWMSPVRCRLKSSMGTICEYPPPAAPPLMPKVGPIEGWRMQVNTFLPSSPPSAWLNPTVVVVLPSPRGVGVMAVTSMYLALGLSLRRSRTSR